MSLQDAFKAMLRDQVAPVLRQEGFRGSGQKFRLRAPDGSTALVVFQKHKWNTESELELFVNLSVFPSKLWRFLREDQQWMPEEPDWGHPAPWDGRLETLVGRPWIAHSVADLDALVPPLLAALRDVVPVMKRYLQEEEMVGFLQEAFEWNDAHPATAANEPPVALTFASTGSRGDLAICVLLSDKRDARFDAALARLERAGHDAHPSAPFARKMADRLKRP